MVVRGAIYLALIAPVICFGKWPLPCETTPYLHRISVWQCSPEDNKSMPSSATAIPPVFFPCIIPGSTAYSSCSSSTATHPCTSVLLFHNRMQEIEHTLCIRFFRSLIRTVKLVIINVIIQFAPIFLHLIVRIFIVLVS